MASGYTLKLRNNVTKMDTNLFVQSKDVGWTKADDAETVSHTLTISFKIEHPFRFYLYDYDAGNYSPLFGATVCPLARHCGLRLASVSMRGATSNEAEMQQALGTWFNAYSDADFVSITRGNEDIEHHPASGEWSCMRVVMHNDPHELFDVNYTYLKYYTSRQAFREYLFNPAHIFIIINPFLPWYRKLWLLWYFWLPRDFQGTYNCHAQGDPNMFRLQPAVADEQVQPRQQQPAQPRRSQRLEQQH